MNGMVVSGAPPADALLPALVVSTMEVPPPAPLCPTMGPTGPAALVAPLDEQLDATSTSDMARMVAASLVDALL